MSTFFGFHMPSFTFPGVPVAKLYDRVTDDAPVDRLGEYIDAGFGGFTFGNRGLPTAESMELAGQLIKAVRGR